VADDGYSTSQVATVTVNVSDAPLVKLDFQVRQPRLDTRHSMTLELVGNFTDEQNVALPASYLQFHSTNPASGIVTLHGLANGTGVITASTAYGPGGVTIQAATGKRSWLSRFTDLQDEPHQKNRAIEVVLPGKGK